MAHDILIVDDENDIRVLVADVLRDEGYEARTAGDSDAALAAVNARRPALVLLDIWLQGSTLDGIEVLDILHRENPDLPVVMISGHGNIETAVTAIHKGAYDYLEKPFKTDRLLMVIERAIEAATLRRENRELRLRAGHDSELLGASPAMERVAGAIDRVAPTGSRVLIRGPSGVGKEIVARRIHARSRRAAGPFVTLNAAMLAPERVEEELFGAEADAQGASRKVGTFEQAHGGTLFLDEVADMPLETQGKIVRVLQEQTFQRLGGGAKIEVDVRVIAATNRDLAAEIAGGRFREDFFYRLNVVPIEVPPLRERREDIPLLVKHFMGRSSEAAGLPQRQVGADAMAVLQAADWPGNVRQLRNVVDWLLIMAPGDSHAAINAEMLPPDLGSSSIVFVRPDASPEIMALALRQARELFERQYLEAQISRFGGNISRTAVFVGMERSALHRKLKSLGVGERNQSSDGDRPAVGTAQNQRA